MALTCSSRKTISPACVAIWNSFFADPPADRSTWRSATTCEKGHGHIEIRTLAASADLNEYFARDWRGIAHVFRLERTVIEKRKCRTSVVYGFTSLSPKQADPARLLTLLRAHWAIENRLHYVRDVCFGEDRSRLRTSQTPQILAAFRTLVITLIHRQGSTQIAASRRHFASHPCEALDLLLFRTAAQH